MLKNHSANPLTRDQLFSREEFVNFIAELSQNWSISLKQAVHDWSDNHLDSLLSFLKRALASIGREILRSLGHAAGVMNCVNNNG